MPSATPNLEICPVSSLQDQIFVYVADGATRFVEL